MKKTINVNMFGMLYPIDEDAYNLLSNYLDSLQKYFMSRPGGAEIANDIEARVAELMNELMAGGCKAVTVADVEQIIGRIGNPEEIDPSGESEPKQSAEAPGQEPVAKKLYRDTDHRIVGGVLAGLGEYFGVKPVWLRVVAIVLLFASVGWFVPVYALAWILIPAAVTPLQRLEMKGEPINLDSIRDMILENVAKMRHGSERLGLGTRLAQAARSLARGVLYVLCGGLVIASVAAFVFGGFMYVQAMLAVYGSESACDGIFTQCIATASPVLLTVALVSGVVCLAGVVVAGVYAMFALAGRYVRVRPWAVISMVLVFAVSLTVFLSSFVPVVAAYDRENSLYYQARNEERSRERSDRNKRMLQDEGWTVVRGANVGGGFLNHGEHYSGNRGKHYLDAWESGGTMAVDIARTQKVAPGVYTLQAMGRANGYGAEIYAKTSAGRYATEIAPNGDEGGDVWSEAKAAKSDATLTDSDRALMKQYAKVHGGRGYGWSKVAVGDIKVGADSLITYGVTNDGPASSWNGSWFSATEFVLRRK